MPATTQKPLNRRDWVAFIATILITLATFSLAVVMGVLGDAIEVRALAGFTFLASVITLTLLLIFDLIARYDRASVPKGNGS